MTVATEQSVLRRYLLGELSEAETERLEESIYTDDDVFAEMQTAEMSLVDEYVRGEMDKAERKLFEANYLVSPEREAKLRESRIFHSELNAIRPLPAAREEKVGWLERWFGGLRLSLPAMRYASAALILVLAATTAWLVYDNRKTTNELAVAKNTLANSENALNERLADKERELNDRLAAQRGEDSESLSVLQNEIEELH